MARIFLSHSSKDNAQAIALRDWLTAEGWDDLFLDLDPERGIVAGDRWERALHQAVNRCEAVLFLISSAWLSSRWCLKELGLAHKLNKRIFGILIEDIAIAKLPADITESWQLVNLAQGHDHVLVAARDEAGKEEHVSFSRAGLARLRAGLNKAGLDARFFEWPPKSDPDRSPYRGLRPLEKDDAGIFFGREAPVIETLDRLRGLREASPPRLVVILGASGAGKSSFLRAGLLPRLARDDRNFHVLPVIRPERAAVSGDNGLLNSLDAQLRSLGIKVARPEVRTAIDAGIASVGSLLERIAKAAQVVPAGRDEQSKPPSLIIPIDQAEEFFGAEGGEEAQQALQLLAGIASAATPNVIVILTIRSDAYERLQSAPALDGLQQHTLSLPPMPKGAYHTVIEGPVARLKEASRRLRIEPALIDALLNDLETGGAKDSLPLLAFTLERLYADYGGTGELKLAHYRSQGGIRGGIEAAVERAFRTADNDPAVPRDRAARLALLRRALIPWLAGIDPETGAPRRRVARYSEIPEETRPLVGHLVEQRLLALDVSQTGERTIEPAHEALLRQWGLLQGWLEESFMALAAADGVKSAARDWKANAQDATWLVHAAGRLEDAEALCVDEAFTNYLGGDDRAYLAACRLIENERRNRELEDAKRLADAQRKAARRTRVGLVAAGLLAVIASLFGLYAIQKSNDAEAQAEVATRRSAFLAIDAANGLTKEGDIYGAMLLQLEAAKAFSGDEVPDKLQISFHQTLEIAARRSEYALPKDSIVRKIGSALIIGDGEKGDIYRLDEKGWRMMAAGENKPIFGLGRGFDPNDVLIVRSDYSIEWLNGVTGKIVKVGAFPPPKTEGGRRSQELDFDQGIVRLSFAETAKENEKSARSYLFDLQSKVMSEVNAWVGSDLARLADGRVYLFDERFDERNEKYAEVVIKAGTLELVNGNDAAHLDEIRYRSCAGSDLPPASPELKSRIAEIFKQHLYDNLTCRRLGTGILFSYESGGTGGTFINYILLMADNREDDIGELLKTNGIKYLGNSLTGIGTDVASEKYVALTNRDAYVLDGFYPGPHIRFAYPPLEAFMLGGERIAVIEGDGKRVTVHDIRSDMLIRPAITSPQKGKLDKVEHQLSTYHPGSCVGMSGALLPERRLLDGSLITFKSAETFEIAHGASKEITQFQFRPGTRCVQFSPDWKQLAVVGEGSVRIFDVATIRAADALGEPSVEIPIGSPITAFFSGDSLITTDYSRSVQRWRLATGSVPASEEIFRGDAEIVYAEPDKSGNLLIIVEHLGGKSYRAFLYSLQARQRWIELGEVYKFLAVAFDDQLDIAVGESIMWQNLIRLPVLQQLKDEALAALPERCRPFVADDYRSSACWPETAVGD